MSSLILAVNQNRYVYVYCLRSSNETENGLTEGLDEKFGNNYA